MLITILSIDCQNRADTFTIDDTTVSHSTFVNCDKATGFIFTENVKAISEMSINMISYSCSFFDFSRSPCTIANMAFPYNRLICRILIGPDVVSIGSGAFFSYAENVFVVDEGNPNIKLVDNLLVDFGRKMVVWSSRINQTHIIPEGITTIGSLSFYGTSQNLFLPASVGAIINTKQSPFNSKSGTITLGIGSPLKTGYGGMLLYNETALIWGSKSLAGAVELPPVVEIGPDAFLGCQGITDLKLPQSLKLINYQAFHSTALTNIVIPKHVTNVRMYAFYGTCLQTVAIESPKTTVAPDAFASSTVQTLFISCSDTPGRYKYVWPVLPNIDYLDCTPQFTTVVIGTRRFVVTLIYFFVNM